MVAMLTETETGDATASLFARSGQAVANPTGMLLFLGAIILLAALVKVLDANGRKANDHSALEHRRVRREQAWTVGHPTTARFAARGMQQDAEPGDVPTSDARAQVG